MSHAVSYNFEYLCYYDYDDDYCYVIAVKYGNTYRTFPSFSMPAWCSPMLVVKLLPVPGELKCINITLFLLLRDLYQTAVSDILFCQLMLLFPTSTFCYVK